MDTRTLCTCVYVVSVVMVAQTMVRGRPLHSDGQTVVANTEQTPKLYPGMLVGDVILTQSDIHMLSPQVSYNSGKRIKRKIIDFDDYPTRKWTFPIKYYIDNESYGNETYSHAIRRALQGWEEVTCVQFEELENLTGVTERHLYFINRPHYGCSSYLGRVHVNATMDQGLENVYSQPVYLSTAYCFQYLGTAMHEIGHALGLLHETQRPDRNDHVVVLLDNIRNGTIMNFLAFSDEYVQNGDVPYDLGSLMQYPSLVYTVNRDELDFTSLPLESEKLLVMGQYVEIGFYDAKVINIQYCGDPKPDSNRTDPIWCSNDGYPDPRDGGKCICPAGWSGDYCQLVDVGTQGCEPTSGVLNHMSASDVNQDFSLFSPNYNDLDFYFTAGDQCYWVIKTLPSQHIGWWFSSESNQSDANESDAVLGLAMSRNVGCQAWVEVKKPGDIRGIRVCGLYYNSTDLGMFANVTWSYSSEIQVSFHSFDTALEVVPIQLQRGFHFKYTIAEKPSTIEKISSESILRSWMDILEIQFNVTAQENPDWMKTYIDALYGGEDTTTEITTNYAYIDQSKTMTKMILGLCLGAGCAVILFIIGLFYCCKDKSKNKPKHKTGSNGSSTEHELLHKKVPNKT